MSGRGGTSQTWLTAAILAHLGVLIAHASVHAGSHIPLSRAATLFVYVVILAGPLVGLALVRRRARLGSSIAGASLAGAFVFGVVNHFIVAGPDNVAYIAPEWRTAFVVTSVLLAVTEALGAVLAAGMARRGAVRP